MWGSVSGPCSVSSIWFSVFKPLPHCRDYCGWMTGLRVLEIQVAFALCCSFFRPSRLLQALCVSVWVLELAPVSKAKPAGIVIGIKAHIVFSCAPSSGVVTWRPPCRWLWGQVRTRVGKRPQPGQGQGIGIYKARLGTLCFELWVSGGIFLAVLGSLMKNADLTHLSVLVEVSSARGPRSRPGRNMPSFQKVHTEAPSLVCPMSPASGLALEVPHPPCVEPQVTL